MQGTITHCPRKTVLIFLGPLESGEDLLRNPLFAPSTTPGLGQWAAVMGNGSSRNKVPHPSQLYDTIGPFTSATILTSHNSGATAGSALFGNYSLIDTPKLKRVKCIEGSPATVRQ